MFSLCAHRIARAEKVSITFLWKGVERVNPLPYVTIQYKHTNFPLHIPVFRHLLKLLFHLTEVGGTGKCKREVGLGWGGVVESKYC